MDSKNAIFSLMWGWEKVPGGRMRGRKEATDQMGDEINARILSEKTILFLRD
jgi:hypothetical protein